MTIRGILLDLEGVLYQEGAAIDGAAEAIAVLQRQGFTLRFLTNTTTQPRRVILERLAGMGLPAETAHLFSPPVAAAALLRKSGLRHITLAAPEPLREEFDGFDLVEEGGDAVVMGDLHKGFTWCLLDRLFRDLQGGARLIALHRNRYCLRDGRLGLDLGPFVAALEYAAAAEAVVVGKPAKAFFDLALDDMGLAAHEVVMVGDDIEADIGGAHDAGLRALQARTGKFTPQDLQHPRVKADATIASIAELPAKIVEIDET